MAVTLVPDAGTGTLQLEHHDASHAVVLGEPGAGAGFTIVVNGVAWAPTSR